MLPPPVTQAVFKETNGYLSSFGVKSGVFAATDVKDNHIVKESLEERIKRYGRKIEGLKLFFDVTSPEVKDITPLAELCEYAHSRNMKVMVHSSNSPVPMQSLLSELCKGDILTHAYHGGANNSAEDNFECLKAAKSHGIIVDVGFAGHVHTDFEVLRQGIESGAVPDTISTDITRLSAYKRGGRYGMTKGRRKRPPDKYGYGLPLRGNSRSMSSLHGGGRILGYYFNARRNGNKYKTASDTHKRTAHCGKYAQKTFIRRESKIIE